MIILNIGRGPHEKGGQLQYFFQITINNKKSFKKISSYIGGGIRGLNLFLSENITFRGSFPNFGGLHPSPFGSELRTFIARRDV